MLPEADKIDRQQRENGAELDQHGESLAEILVVETEEALDQKEMPGRGHRQELGQALDDAEDECLEQLERHDGLRRQMERKTAAQRQARKVREMRFSRIINLGQRGSANIAQVAPGRLYP